MRKKILVVSCLLAVSLGFAVRLSAHGATVKPVVKEANVVMGDFKIMGNGTVRSWARLGKNGRATAVGITFSETALTGLPKGVKGDLRRSSFEYLLQVPPQARALRINHISFDWEPFGHEPRGIYDVAHFDLHFYNVSVQDRNKIMGRGMAPQKMYKKPAAQFVPARYILAPGTGVPRMGAHWMNTAAPELRGRKFTHTFVYGSYDGRFTFLEPMFAKSFLDTKPKLQMPIALPKAVSQHGFYPTRYSVSHDPLRHEYSIALENFQWR
ncbi:MAG TPA: DUF5602 domain-containing protein [Abditibacteriaceae bacterium]|nr:DUF5602 domain-containing protein [Abditibacteriaceae bacterium]